MAFQSLDSCLKVIKIRMTPDEDYQVPTGDTLFYTGPAGCGKTHRQRVLLEEDSSYGILCATTGIAAVTLGATTLNSLLKFFQTEDLRDKFTSGNLTTAIHRLGVKYRNLIIDEASMLDARQLDYIFEATQRANQYADMEGRPFGIILTGDFLQLPPVNAPWAFTADSWEHFERNTVKMTTNHRQTDTKFLAALSAARAGRGQECVALLKELGVEFRPALKPNFQGTTIMAVNQDVDAHNMAALYDIKGEPIIYTARTWGEEDSSWKNTPKQFRLKENAYVMILANDPSGLFEYANGDCGTVQQRDADGTTWIKLARNENVVQIRPIIRYKVARGDDATRLAYDTHGLVECSVKGSKFDQGPIKTPHMFCTKVCGWDTPGRRHAQWGYPSYNCNTGSWNVGAISFDPLRLAYATTAYKSQGLTLDTCQIDFRDKFWNTAGMCYVALSRVRSHKGLVIVAKEKEIADQIRVCVHVKRWL